MSHIAHTQYTLYNQRRSL